MKNLSTVTLRVLLYVFKVTLWIIIISFLFAIIELIAQQYPDTWTHYLFADTGVLQGYVTAVVLYSRGLWSTSEKEE